jgi:hypothetical protein
LSHHPSSQLRQSLWTLATVAATLVSPFPRPNLHAQTIPASSSSLANTTSAMPGCSDLCDTPCAPPPVAPAPPPQHHTETSISLGAFAQITPTRLQTNYINSVDIGAQTQGIAPTAGVLGTFRQQFHPWLGYSLNLGYTRADERYTFPVTYPVTALHELHIPSNLYEVSLSYVAQKHLTPRLTGFAEIGAGAVIVLPVNGASTAVPTGSATFDPDVNYRPEGTTGFGLDLRLSQHLDFRAEYRGLLYKNPDFSYLQKSTTWTSEPTLSLVYRFGHKPATSTKQP